VASNELAKVRTGARTAREPHTRAMSDGDGSDFDADDVKKWEDESDGAQSNHDSAESRSSSSSNGSDEEGEEEESADEV
jgi:hypothetical protein